MFKSQVAAKPFFLLLLTVLLSLAMLEPARCWAVFGGFEVIPAEVRGASRIGFLVTVVDQKLVTCTGTLIEERIVLTASHCVTRFRPLRSIAEMSILFMTSDLRLFKVIDGSYLNDMHPNSVLENPAGQIGDLALMLLEKPVDNLNPNDRITLALPGELNAPDALNIAYGYGYGQSEPGKTPEHLRGRTIRGTTRTHADVFFDGFMALVPANGLMCYGDSGGPLLVYGADGSATLVGVLSQLDVNPGGRSRLSSEPCLVTDWEYWTSVSAHSSWIQHTIEKLYRKHETQKEPTPG
jgi:hypothetical protein